MADPIRFDGHNKVFIADGCGDLPAFVTKVTLADKEDLSILTCWKLTGEELTKVLQSGRIWVRVYGAQPPIEVMGDPDVK